MQRNLTCSEPNVKNLSMNIYYYHGVNMIPAGKSLTEYVEYICRIHHAFFHLHISSKYYKVTAEIEIICCRKAQIHPLDSHRFWGMQSSGIEPHIGYET